MKSISGEKHLLAQFALWNQTPLNLQLFRKQNKTKQKKAVKPKPHNITQVLLKTPPCFLHTRVSTRHSWFATKSSALHQT